MSQKVFIEKTQEIKGFTIIMDWSMGKYGVTVSREDTTWQTETYEFEEEADAQSAFELATVLCESLVV